jgi:hypothetical protein
VDGQRPGRSGEIAAADEVHLAAAAFAHGIDGWKLLTTEDPFERSVLLAVIERAVEVREGLDDRLAVSIINRLAESMGGKG